MNKQVLQAKDLVLCAFFTALIATGAFIKIPIPVVPFTLQFLFTNLAGLLLGKRLGFFSVAAYIVIGLCGLPIFTSGGGPGYLLSPTFGYIIGFMLGAWIAGYIVEKSKLTGFKTYLTAGFFNLAVVYLTGMVYYYFISNYYMKSPIGIGALFLYCFVLAVPGDVVLCFLSASLAKQVLPLLKKGVI